MDDLSRESILSIINEFKNFIKENKVEIALINYEMKTEDLSKEEIDDLNAEKEFILEDIVEIKKDIAVYEEMLHIIELNDDRSSSPYDDRYDSREEVFTAGDY